MMEGDREIEAVREIEIGRGREREIEGDKESGKQIEGIERVTERE